MVYACFWYDGRSELIAMERDPLAAKEGYSARSYVWALEDGLMPIYEPLDIYQMDNAPIHASNLVKRWLETHGVWTLDFPPYSPDLNPIEHLWLALKRKVLELYPELEHMGQSKEDLERLIEACKEAWMALDQGLMRRLIDSMERRLKAVRKADGWQTKY
jgi:DDE superfamily endonuclease